MTKNIFLHISDLHFDNHKERDISIILNSMYEDIARINDKYNIKPNFVIFTGDVIQAGDEGYSSTLDNYENVKEKVFFPLLNKLDLTTDNLLLCPGNHDIQKSLIEEISEIGAKTYFKDKSSVNKYLDRNLDLSDQLCVRMSNYEKFFNSLTNKHIIFHDIFLTIYAVPNNTKGIGIAAFNSAWRSVGEKSDYGKLLIGDRTVNNSLTYLKEYEIRMAIAHHPFDCLQDFEKVSFRRLFPTFFNFWITGHNHDLYGSISDDLQNNTLISLSGGALYNSRDYYNGYEIIDIESTQKICQLYRAEYNDREQKFFSCPSEKAINEFVPISIERIKELNPPNIIYYLDTLRNNILPILNTKLIKSDSNGGGQKNLCDIFVTPTIYNEHFSKIQSLEGNIHDKTEYEISLNKVLDQNSLLIGKKESGKTTLIYYLIAAILNNSTPNELCFPIYISFQDLPQGKNRIEKAINNYLLEYQVNCLAVDILAKEKWILFVDDFNFQDTKNISALNEFMKNNPDGKIIVSIDEGLVDKFINNYQVDSKKKFQKCFVQPFGRKEIRLLTENWLKGNHDDYQPGDIADIIIRRISEINLEFSPLIISMMLVSIEEKHDYFPINKASLVENIIELILEKTNPSEKFPGGIDYRVIEDFLCKFSQHLSTTNMRDIKEIDFLEFIDTYFQKRSQDLVGGVNKFYNFIVDRGILLNVNGNIGFKFTCYFEYFLAKLMTYDETIYNSAILSHKLLTFSGPLEYLAGLQRNNKPLLSIISNFVKENYKKFSEEEGIESITLGDYDKLSSFVPEISESQHIDKEVEISSIKNSKLSEVDKDNLAKKALSTQTTQKSNKVKLKDKENNEIERTTIQGISLYANVLKNCELIDDESFKINCLHECFDIFFRCVYSFIIRLDKQVDDMTLDELIEWGGGNFSDYDFSKITPNNLPEIKVIVKNQIHSSVVFFLQSFFCMEIETPKLNKVAIALIESDRSQYIEKIACLRILLDTKSTGYVSIIEKVTKVAIGSVFRSTLLANNLRYHYSYSNLKKDDQSKIESILADLIIFVKRFNKRYKPTLISELARKRTLEEII